MGSAQKVKNSGRNGIRTGSGNDRVRFGGGYANEKRPIMILLCTGYPVATAPGSDIGSYEALFVQSHLSAFLECSYYLPLVTKLSLTSGATTLGSVPALN